MGNRSAEIDSLRGCAAAVVLIAHSLNYLPHSVGQRSEFSYAFVWDALINGRVSVLLFFCMSGFVLSYPYFLGTKNERNLKLDIVNRLPRLLVPIFIAGVATYFLQSYFSRQEILPFENIFANYHWAERWRIDNWSVVDAMQFLLFRVLFGYDNLESYNVNLWTMPIEFAYSFMVFALVSLFVGRRNQAVACFFLWLLLCLTWQSGFKLRIWFVIDGAQFLFGVICAYLCLLYTSPSPRD